MNSFIYKGNTRLLLILHRYRSVKIKQDHDIFVQKYFTLLLYYSYGRNGHWRVYQNKWYLLNVKWRHFLKCIRIL